MIYWISVEGYLDSVPEDQAMSVESTFTICWIGQLSKLKQKAKKKVTRDKKELKTLWFPRIQMGKTKAIKS